MRQLISDLFVSLDGYGAAERTGGYFDMFGPDTDSKLSDEDRLPDESD